MGVRTTSPSFAEWLDYALGAYRTERPGPIAYSIVVADEGASRTGTRPLNILYRDTTPLLRTLDLGALARAVLEELEGLTLPSRDDFVYLRAARITAGEVTGVVPAPLFFAVAQRARQARRMGLVLPTTTTVAVDPSSASVSSVTPQLRVPADAQERLGTPVDRDHFPSPVEAAAAVDVICTWSWEAAGAAAVRRVSRGSTLYRLAPCVLNADTVGPVAFTALGLVVASARCFEIAGPFEAGATLRALAAALVPEGAATAGMRE